MSDAWRTKRTDGNKTCRYAERIPQEDPKIDVLETTMVTYKLSRLTGLQGTNV